MVSQNRSIDYDPGLLQTADVLAKTESATQRMVIATERLGKAGIGLLPVLLEGRDGLSAMIDREERLSGITEGLAEKSKVFHDSLKDMQTVGQSLVATIAESILPNFQGMIDKILALRDAVQAFQRWAGGMGGKEGLFAGTGAKRGLGKIEIPQEGEFLSKADFDDKRKEIELENERFKLHQAMAQFDLKMDPEQRLHATNELLGLEIANLGKIKDLGSLAFTSVQYLSRNSINSNQTPRPKSSALKNKSCRKAYLEPQAATCRPFLKVGERWRTRFQASLPAQ